MILFTDIEVLISKTDFSYNILFNRTILNWIKKQQFEAIVLVSNQKGIAEGWLDEKFFDTKIQYIIETLKDFIGIEVFCQYYPYENSNKFLIKDFLLNKGIKRKDAVFLGNNKTHKQDAFCCGIKYINYEQQLEAKY